MSSEKKTNRRDFLKTGAAAGTLAAGWTAASAQRVMGANDSIRIGIIGCGGRGAHHMGWIHRASQEVPAKIVAVCDVWDQQVERAAAFVQERFGGEQARYRDHRKLLESRDIDAVLIATPDHLHCPHLMDAVRAGKDAYVEKPIAIDLDVLNQTCDVVKASGQIVQHGTQGRSSKGAAATRAFIQSGQLGKILRVEESRSHYNPYWNNYKGPESEDHTRWPAFLDNRPYRPFNSDQHGAWMGYLDFSNGTVGGWMSHFSDFLHYCTGCGFPRFATGHGGVYSPTSKEGRTCPDTITVILDYEEGFTTSYTTHFGNAANDYTLIFGTKGTMRIDMPDGNDKNGINPRVSGEGSEHPEKVKEGTILEEIKQDDHMVNWLKSMRDCKQPNADMDKGYMQGVAVILGDMACVKRRMMTFDPVNREIRPA
ncbi:MAG: Gfo/Idh/MocA family oxidoreductase [Candidatus Omnitrophota bacterium]